MKVHFIAIGGSVMHHLAITLKLKGYDISGSDDEIYEPARSNLKKYGLLPLENGWFSEKIDDSIDAIILGMHAREDNPELQKARQLGLKIYSYPAYIYEQSKDKKRVVIAGSHGKTTITSMVMHVLNYLKKDFDYLVGAQLKGFERMVKITNDAPIIVIEGDEYLASALEKKPKFLFYKPDISIITGIAWDHINAFPTLDIYIDQFRQYLHSIPKSAILIYNEIDELLNELIEQEKSNLNIQLIKYRSPNYIVKEGKVILQANGKDIPLKIFGEHNLFNLEGAHNICRALNITDTEFYEAIQSFEGAAKRLEKLLELSETLVYKDFAHSPSKVKATVDAVKELFPQRNLVACLELHTYSSLNKNFLQQYQGTMELADEAYIFLNEHAMKMKRMELSQADVKDAFQKNNLEIFTKMEPLKEILHKKDWRNKNLLMMSSGNFGNTDLIEFATFVTKAEN